MNKKETKREERFEIKMTKKEKDIFKEYAENLGINPARMARNILMQEAEKNIVFKGIEKATMKTYIKYLEATNQEYIIKKMKSE